MRIGEKVAGQCLGCRAVIRPVLETIPAGPLAGHPRRLGPPTAAWTQVEWLLSDGSEADVECCVDCAASLTPADYGPLWRACVARSVLSFQAQGRWPSTAARLAITRLMQTRPMAVRLWRRLRPGEAESALPTMEVDPRWRAHQATRPRHG